LSAVSFAFLSKSSSPPSPRFNPGTTSLSIVDVVVVPIEAIAGFVDVAVVATPLSAGFSWVLSVPDVATVIVLRSA